MELRFRMPFFRVVSLLSLQDRQKSSVQMDSLLASRSLPIAGISSRAPTVCRSDAMPSPLTGLCSRSSDMKIHAWNSALGSMSEESIRELHQPAERFRVSRKRYLTGTAFPGAMRSGTCYVLAGACQYIFNDRGVIELRRGEYAKLPEGSYSFSVIGDESVDLVMAWELPPALFERPS